MILSIHYLFLLVNIFVLIFLLFLHLNLHINLFVCRYTVTAEHTTLLPEAGAGVNIHVIPCSVKHIRHSLIESEHRHMSNDHIRIELFLLCLRYLMQIHSNHIPIPIACNSSFNRLFDVDRSIRIPYIMVTVDACMGNDRPA